MTDEYTINLTEDENRIIKAFKDIRLKGFALALHRQYTTPDLFNRLTFNERLTMALHEHIDYVNETKSQTLLKRSKLKGNLELDEIIQSEERGISPLTMAELASLSFIIKKQNVIIRGASGTGKTELICNLGKRACLRGMSVQYTIASDLLDEISILSVEQRLKYREKLRKVQLLILDDLFLTDFSDPSYARYLNDILNDRINNASTLIATQLTTVGMARRFINIDAAITDAVTRRITKCAYDITLLPFNFA